MEVEAGSDGYLAATLAEAGEDVPVGEAMAIISAEKPDAPVARSARKAPKTQEAAAPAAEAGETDAATPAPSERPRAAPAPAAGGRILASPKARRLALEEGLDLARLAEAGHPQPFHVADLEALRALPETSPAATAQAAAVARRLTAETDADGLPAFAAWAADAHGLTDAGALLAGLAGASLGGDAPVAIAVERFGTSRTYAVPPGRRLSEVTGTDEAPGLVVRDLRGTRLATVELGAEAVPVLTLASRGAGLSVTLECAPAHLDAAGAIRLLTDFAGRMREPLRHLL